MTPHEQLLHRIGLAVLALITLLTAWIIWDLTRPAPEPGTIPVATGTTTPSPTATTAAEGLIVWDIFGDSEGWRPQKGETPPECPAAILSQSPVDVSLASSILWPGQYRGTHFKAHGGFRFDGRKNTDISVRLPFDGYLTGATRYIESGELQYLLTFQHPCGFMIRFDHLSHPTETMFEVINTTPEAKENDTRGYPLTVPPPFVPAGTVIATGVGLPKAGNVSVDFGLYDLRARNSISQNAAWAAIHQKESSQNFHGVCWLDYLPAADRDTLLQLPTQTDDRGASDYCAQAPGGSTLDYNGGQPVSR